VYDVTLFYGDQTVELVTEGISIDNAPQMGTITIEKRDKETGKPIILSDAVFQLHAKEDIVTGDGVVHYKAGELVDYPHHRAGVIASSRCTSAPIPLHRDYRPGVGTSWTIRPMTYDVRPYWPGSRWERRTTESRVVSTIFRKWGRLPSPR